MNKSLDKFSIYTLLESPFMNVAPLIPSIRKVIIMPTNALNELKACNGVALMKDDDYSVLDLRESEAGKQIYTVFSITKFTEFRSTWIWNAVNLLILSYAPFDI